MLVPRRAILLACALAILAAASVASASVLPAPSTHAAKAKKGKGKKKCPKGYKLVTKHGTKTKTCKKKHKPVAPVCRQNQASASCAVPGPTGLFEAPGRKLEGDAAKPFLEKYLVNSTFTDCPAGWPNCSVEQRYSHTSGGFYYCRLTSVSGADIINGARNYQVQNAVVEADGSWTFNEQVENSGGPAFYEWHVATNGGVNGAYQFNGGAIEQIGPLQYIHTPKDCSY